MKEFGQLDKNFSGRASFPTFNFPQMPVANSLHCGQFLLCHSFRFAKLLDARSTLFHVIVHFAYSNLKFFWVRRLRLKGHGYLAM